MNKEAHMENANNLKIAAIQMIATANPVQNLATAEKLVRQAAVSARLIILPEFFIQISQASDPKRFTYAEHLGSGPIQEHLASLAKELQIYLLAGTILIKTADSKKFYNTSLLYSPEGKLCCHYKKIHLFKFTDKDQTYDEGEYLIPGKDLVTYEIDGFRFGFSICYDLRFPELFRKMGKLDAIILPAAFTYTTGKAHWEILSRARAIENQCYFIAVNQGGLHEIGRHTYGHTLIANPWGELIANCEEGEQILYATLDKSLIKSIRQNLPALEHHQIVF